MEPIELDATPETPYRLPSRHPLAGRAARAEISSADGNADASEQIARTVTDGGAASEIKRRQEALLLTYLIHRSGR